MIVNPRLRKAVYNAIAAVCPVTAVNVGDWPDKSTWSIVYDPSATQAQKDAATAALTAFDVTAQNDSLNTADTTAATYPLNSNYQDLITNLRGKTPAQVQTYVTNNVTDLASAKVLLAKILLILGTLV